MAMARSTHLLCQLPSPSSCSRGAPELPPSASCRRSGREWSGGAQLGPLCSAWRWSPTSGKSRFWGGRAGGVGTRNRSLVRADGDDGMRGGSVVEERNSPSSECAQFRNVSLFWQCARHSFAQVYPVDLAFMLDRGSDVRVQREQHSEGQTTDLSSWLYPSKEDLPDDKEMTLFDHLDELRDRMIVSVGAVGVAILGCFAVAKDLIVFLEAPVYNQGVRFLQLSPGEFFFTTLKVAGYSGLLLGSPVILYEIIAFVLPGLTRSERKFLGPIVLGSSILFYFGIAFSYAVLTPAALNFFVQFSEGAVESFWSIDRYFEFVLLLMFSTGLAFQVPVIQLLLGQTGLFTGDQMLSIWRYVVVGAVIAAAILTPSTDPLTQVLLAGPLIGLYVGGAFLVKALRPDNEPVE